MHVDTGHNFPEVIAYRDRRVAELGETLLVASVQESIDKGRVVEESGPRACGTSCRRRRCSMRSRSIASTPRSAAPDATRSAPARKSGSSASATTSASGTRAQRPELWNLYNARVRRGEHVRVFPISNWTELDVWQYVAREQLELPSIYFAHERDVFKRDVMLYAVSEFVEWMDGEEPFAASVRFRRRHELHGRGCVGREDARAGRGRDRRDARDRARRDARRRPGLGGGDGGQEARYFEQLLATELVRLVTAGSVTTASRR